MTDAIKERQDHDIHARIINLTSVELVQGFATVLPVQPDMVVEPGSAVFTDSQSAGKDLCDTNCQYSKLNYGTCFIGEVG